jgi:tetratricopeptide (TPR) repeat protein
MNYLTRILCSLFVIASLPAVTPAFDEQIPYDVSDAQRLVSILSEAKSILSQHPRDVAQLKKAGIASHQLAVLKTDGASAEAVTFLQEVIELTAHDAEALAYLGSAHTMLARDKTSVITKLTAVNKGLSLLDKAVLQESRSIRIRRIRAGATYNLPAMFKRRQTAFDDYLFVAKAAEKSKTQNKESLAEVYFKLGVLLKESDDQVSASEYFSKAQRIAPASFWAGCAKKEQQK